MGFQTQVNITPAPAVEGDFASNNPRSVVLAGPGGLVTGPFGVTVGKFAWIEANETTVNSFGTAPAAPAGFVHRDQQALITVFLAQASMVIPQGFPVTLHRSGDFWAKNLGPSALTRGATIYAGYADGGIYSAAPAGFSGTASDGSTNTASLGATFTATGTGTSMAVTAVTGYLSIGDTIAGTGVPAATTILAQVSGTAGGAGTYTTSAATTVAAGTVTSFGNVVKVTATTGLISIGDTISGGAGFPVGATVTGNPSAGFWTLSAPGTAYTASATGVTTWGTVLDVTAVTSGTLAPGQPIATGTGLVGLSITSQLSGTVGGVGLYSLTAAPTTAAYVASEAFTTSGGIATAWFAIPTSPGDGAVGSLVKISLFAN